MGDYTFLSLKKWVVNVDRHRRWPIRLDWTKLAANVFADGYIYIMDILHQDKPEMYISYPNPFPPLSLVHGQKESSRRAVGYVIHRGNTTDSLVLFPTNPLFLNQFSHRYLRLNWQLHHLRPPCWLWQFAPEGARTRGRVLQATSEGSVLLSGEDHESWRGAVGASNQTEPYQR